MVSSSDFILRDPTNMLVHTPDSRLRCIRARVPWKECLSRSFGQDFHRLLSCSAALAGIFGSAARIYLALAKGEADVGGFSRADFFDFVEGTYGKGFATNINAVFPELANAKIAHGIRSTLSKTVREARSIFEESALSLQWSYCCRFCNVSSSYSGDDEANEPLCLFTSRRYFD